MNAIEVTQLRKTYGAGATAYAALRGVDLQVREGEVVMLSGPSGSGKTTLLSVLGCVLTASSGRVTLMGRDVSGARERDLPQLRLSLIGFVFQAHNLIASRSVRDNVSWLLELRGFARAAARDEAQRLLGLVGMADKQERLPVDLSGGQRQRVAIARALAGNPPFLLADEPTASLDAQNGMAVMELLRKLARDERRTVVIVTHDARIFHLADRIVHIEDGLIARGDS